MQLDLLYKGLPSAKADTRKFRVQIHSDAISFTQREGGSGRKGQFTPVLLPAAPRPSSPASVTFPPGAGEDGERGKKKERKRLWLGWSVPGAAQGPGCPSPGTHRGHRAGVPKPRLQPGPPVPSAPGTNRRGSVRLGGRVNKAKPLWFIAGSAAALPSPPLPPAALPVPHPSQRWFLTTLWLGPCSLVGENHRKKKKNTEN